MYTFEQLDAAREWFRSKGPPGANTPEWSAERAKCKEAQWKAVVALRNDPLLQRYIALCKNGAVSPRNVEPWHGLGVQRLISLAIFDPPPSGLTQHLKFSAGYVPDDAPETDRGLFQQVQIGIHCFTGMPYLWAHRMLTTALAAPLPTHVVSRDLLPYPVMFWAMEYGSVGERNANLTVGEWFLVADIEEGIWCVTSHIDRTADGAALVDIFIPYGSTYPNDFDDDDRANAAQMLQMLAFLNSHFVESRAERIPRHLRREIERQNTKRRAGDTLPADPTVNVVVLRRAAQEAIDAQAAHEHGGYKHQWWVSGHYRAQWYPSIQAHQVRWIAPYLKGPVDAPLLTKVYTVVR